MGWIADHSLPSDVHAKHSRLKIVILCGLLLSASAINYMDRQTLAAASIRITKEFGLTEMQSGNVEARFGIGFALGSLLFGVLVDYLSVRWLYPCALLLWSAMGFLTGYADTYDHLLLCRGLLGFFEAAHWPCALATTMCIFGQNGRALGNSVLQSGTSIGAFITPLVMLWIMENTQQGWRLGFQLVGVIGLAWIVVWLLAVKGDDLRRTSPSSNVVSGQAAVGPWSWLSDLFSQRMLVILVVVSMINSSWQVLRAWLPKIMVSRGYTESESLYFNSLWFLVTDVGCLGAGYLAYRMATRGWSVRISRLSVFSLCVVMGCALAAVPSLPKGNLLLLAMLLAGAGTLGLFPLYYSFTQDVSKYHIGKVTGCASFIGWMISAPVQRSFGELVDITGNYDAGLYRVVLMLIMAMISLWVFWPRDATPITSRG